MPVPQVASPAALAPWARLVPDAAAAARDPEAIDLRGLDAAAEVVGWPTRIEAGQVVSLDTLRRHPVSDIAHLPLDPAGRDWFMLFCPERDGAPDPAGAQLFRLRPTEGLVCRHGTWRAGPFCTAGAAFYTQLMKRDGGRAETLAPLAAPLVFSLGD